MVKEQIDERRILEWAGFKITKLGTLEGHPQNMWHYPDGGMAVKPDIRSLDFQSRYLWSKLDWLDITKAEKGYAVDIEYSGKHYFTKEAQLTPAEACLLAIMEILKEQDKKG